MQEEQIELLKEGDDNKLLVEIYMSELARVRYLLRAYLRTRLQKIERHVMHVLDNAGAASQGVPLRIQRRSLQRGPTRAWCAASHASARHAARHGSHCGCKLAHLPLPPSNTRTRRHGGAAVGQGVAVCARLLCAVWQPHEGSGSQPPARCAALGLRCRSMPCNGAAGAAGQ